MDLGIQQAATQAPAAALPTAWLGRAEAPFPRPDWAAISGLTSVQHRNLLSQMAYNFSTWAYDKIGTNNELGRYQFTVEQLEYYGLLAPGSYSAYGTDAVNYQNCWRAPASTYADYLADVTNLLDFLSNKTAQEQLANQRLVDLYNSCVRINTIQGNDSGEVVAGMLYVAWVLGVGSAPSAGNLTGTGAYAWRYSNIGAGAAYYNAGRYAVVVLSK